MSPKCTWTSPLMSTSTSENIKIISLYVHSHYKGIMNWAVYLLCLLLHWIFIFFKYEWIWLTQRWLHIERRKKNAPAWGNNAMFTLQHLLVTWENGSIPPDRNWVTHGFRTFSNIIIIIIYFVTLQSVFNSSHIYLYSP